MSVEASPIAWWLWPVLLFLVTFLIGIVAVLTGLGGGTLFVPIVGAFFPFHLDLVRGAGLLLALSGALSAGPSLMRNGFASLQLALPPAVVASVTSIVGALMGLALPTRLIEAALGRGIPVAALGSRSVDRLGIPERRRRAAAHCRAVHHRRDAWRQDRRPAPAGCAYAHDPRRGGHAAIFRQRANAAALRRDLAV